MSVSFLGVAIYGLAFAFVGAFVTEPAHSTVAQRFYFGAGVSYVALVALFLLAFVVKYVHYLVFRHAGWQPLAKITGDGVAFYLGRRDGEHPVSVDQLGLVDCCVKSPTGKYRSFSNERRDEMNVAEYNGMLVVTWANPPPGRWRVRWYVTENKTKPYEYTRGSFDLPSPAGEMIPRRRNLFGLIE